MWKNIVDNILNSATKIVLIILTVSLCLLVAFGKVTEDAFIPLVWVVYWFYFKQSSTNSGNDLNSKKRSWVKQTEI